MALDASKMVVKVNLREPLALDTLKIAYCVPLVSSCIIWEITGDLKFLKAILGYSVGSGHPRNSCKSNFEGFIGSTHTKKSTKAVLGEP